jgi:ribosomal protein S18 acetylase RimI-like enzyme
MGEIEVVDAHEGRRVGMARKLFEEYSRGVGVDLCFQNFARELAELPGDYRPPGGALLVGLASGEPVGCVALHAWSGDAAEMKRLFVRRAGRGLGLGRALTLEVVERARLAGYRRLRLDTLPSMQAAIALYRSLGFGEIAPYRENPVPGSLFFELELDCRGLRSRTGG